MPGRGSASIFYRIRPAGSTRHRNPLLGTPDRPDRPLEEPLRNRWRLVVHLRPALAEPPQRRLPLAGTARPADRQVLLELAPQLAEADARRFFDRLKELEPTLKPKFDTMKKSLAGTEEEKRKQMDTFAKAEIEKIAVESLGEKGKALVEKMAGPGR